MTKTKTEVENRKRNKDHDDFVRGIFSYPELVLKILQYAVPDDLKQYIDFSTLKRSSDTHVDDVLEITYSDTIYEAELKKEAIPKAIRRRKKLPNFRFCFLGEFKSSIPNRPIDFQIEDYVRSIQNVDLNNKHSPSIVIPILIYHGVKKWHYKRLYDYFAKYLPQTILEYVSFPKYIVIDLQAMSDADIAAAIGLEELRAAFIALKHAQDKEFFQQHLGEILKFVEDSKPSLLFQTYLKMLLVYSQRRSKLKGKIFNKIVEQLNSNKKMATAFKTMFDVAEEEALAKGKEIGKEIGIAIGEANTRKKIQDTKRKTIEVLVQNTDLTDVQIAQELEVPLSLVEAVRIEFNKRGN